MSGNGFNADIEAILTRYQGRILQYTSGSQGLTQSTRPFFCAGSCATQTWIAYNSCALIKSRVASRTCSRTTPLMHRQVAHSTCKTRSISTRHIRLTEMRKVIAGRALPRQARNRQRDQRCIRLQSTMPRPAWQTISRCHLWRTSLR